MKSPRSLIAAGTLAATGMASALAPGATAANVEVGSLPVNPVACEVTVKPGDTLTGITSRLQVRKADVLDARDANGIPLEGNRPLDHIEGGEDTPQLRPEDTILAIAGQGACEAAGARVIPVEINDPQQFAKTYQIETHSADNQ